MEEAKKESEESILQRMEAASNRLEKANKEYKINQAREEERKITASLEGESEAGQEMKKKEESPAEYAARIMAGETQ